MISAIGTCLLWIVAFFIALLILRLSLGIIMALIIHVAENPYHYIIAGSLILFAIYGLGLTYI
jgi:hypothetical protein